MPKLSDKALRSREARLDSEPPPTTNKGEVAQQAPPKPPPEPHGGIAGKDHPIWQAMRQARADGFILVLPETENEFVADVRLARPILAGALRRAERGESRVEITLREVRL